MPEPNNMRLLGSGVVGVVVPVNVKDSEPIFLSENLSQAKDCPSFSSQ
jgi:hypothetical protein